MQQSLRPHVDSVSSMSGCNGLPIVLWATYPPPRLPESAQYLQDFARHCTRFFGIAHQAMNEATHHSCCVHLLRWMSSETKTWLSRLVREYMELEFKSDLVPFGFSLERVIDDFVMFCMLTGNDFLPCTPCCCCLCPCCPMALPLHTLQCGIAAPMQQRAYKLGLLASRHLSLVGSINST